MAKHCTKITAEGKVQAVGFRFSTRLRAGNLGLTGYAKNLDDGSVEILVCGDKTQIDELIKWLTSGGPKFSKIEDLVYKDFEVNEIPKSFVTY